MFDYLQKFNSLPQNLRDSVSSPAAMAVISDLEKKYKIDLAAIVMKVMVKTTPLSDLASIFSSDFLLDQDSARKLTAELKEKLFFSVSNYLGYIASYSLVLPKTVAVSEIALPDRIIKESGVVFPGMDLNQRLKATLNTFIKGVRSRVDTRITLNKDIASGGLGLDHKIIDNIFIICDHLIPTLAVVPELKIALELPKTGLEKVRALYEKTSGARDIPYDLSAAISKGDFKKPISPVTPINLPVTIAPINLPIPEERSEKLLAEPAEELLISAPTQEKFEIVKVPELQLTIPVKAISHSVPVVPVIPVKINIPFKPDVFDIKKSEPLAAVTPITELKISPTPIKVAEKTAVTDAKVTVAISPVKAQSHPFIDTPATNNSHRIIKPAEKISLWSKLFGSKKVTTKKILLPLAPKVPGVIIVNPIIKPSISILNQSVADRRTQASVARHESAPVKVQAAAPNQAPRQVPRTMSPIDELRFLDLVNFRRLGTSPKEAIAKVSSKIKLLEKTGYESMIKGIMAWKQSPVNKIYLKMGHDALMNGNSLKDFATKAQENKTPGVLFWEEIELIIKLNNQFMF